MRTTRSRLLAAVPLALALLAGGDGGDAAAAAAERARLSRATFERLKSLAGEWRGTSSAGWKDEVEIAVIARGTVVMSTSRHAAHPGETMVSMHHMDGDRLLLTHYCVAGNQPRLVATGFEDGGRRVSFEFLDGTGLSTRDEGHMDRVVYELGDAAYSARWSWYQDGEERWMEEIHLERAR
jgi:hypothetical protein